MTLPDLQLLPTSDVYGTTGALFDWLWAMGVQTIKDLNIPDQRIQPLTEDFVHTKILSRFQVLNLDWRKLDLDISILKSPKTASSLKKLRLYSSGNWSVLYHWASDDGVSALPEVGFCCFISLIYTTDKGMSSLLMSSYTSSSPVFGR